MEIATNVADPEVQKAHGEATYIRETGAAKGAEVEAVGLAKASAYREQVQALGPINTALVNLGQAIADSKSRLVPDILVMGGGSSLEGLLAQLMNKLNAQGAIGTTPVVESGVAPRTTWEETPETVNPS